ASSALVWRPARWSSASSWMSMRSSSIAVISRVLPALSARMVRARAHAMQRSQSCCGRGAISCRLYPLPAGQKETAMSTAPRRVENLHTDKGKVPVYATGVVEQPWDDYAGTDHDTWRRLYEAQREVLVGRASDEFLAAQDAMGMTPDRIPRFSDLNDVLREATGWILMGVEGLLPELDFFDHLANRRFPVTWWIRKPEQFDY